MRISRKEVEKIARLAHLDFSEEELDEFIPQFREILDFIDQLDSLRTRSAEPMYHGLRDEDLSEALREDEASPVLSREEALRNAPEEADGQFRVPKVIE